MTAPSASSSTPSSEIVGLFARPDQLVDCIKDLLSNGFSHADLSVLSTHEAIEAAQPAASAWSDRLLPLVSEARYEVPLVAGALIALAAGPVGAIVAGLAAAGVGAAALKELFEEVISLPDTESFAAAVKAGEIVLWVVAADAPQQQVVSELLTRHGASNVHLHQRAA